jgi:hypothetical protein
VSLFDALLPSVLEITIYHHHHHHHNHVITDVQKESWQNNGKSFSSKLSKSITEREQQFSDKKKEKNFSFTYTYNYTLACNKRNPINQLVVVGFFLVEMGAFSCWV